MFALKICLVSYEYPPQAGGEASYTQALATGLAHLGHHVTLVVPEQGRRPVRDTDMIVGTTAVPVVNLPLLKVGSFLLEAEKRLHRLAREGEADLVHFTFDYPSLPLHLSDLGVPSVATVHHLHQVEALSVLHAQGPALGSFPGILRGLFTTLMERTLIADAGNVIAVSEFTRESLVRYVGLAKDRIHVIPNGIDATPFLSSVDVGTLRARLGLGSRPVVLFVGRLEPSKGLEYLIRAFESLGKRPGSPCLLIVGAGSRRYFTRLRSIAAACAPGSVVFAGKLSKDALCEAYALATAFVLPSLMEGFGITLLEAMAAGKPCVASAVGAVPEILIPSRGGVLVKPADPEALSRAIAWVLDNRGEAELMGQRGRRFVEEKYTQREMVGRTVAVYEEALRKH